MKDRENNDKAVQNSKSSTSEQIANGIATLKNLSPLRAMIGSIIGITSIQSTTSTESILKEGGRKTLTMKIYAILFATLAVYFGIEQNSPNYSIVNCIETITTNWANNNHDSLRIGDHKPACKPTNEHIIASTAKKNDFSISIFKLAPFSLVCAIFIVIIALTDKTNDPNKLKLLYSGKYKPSFLERTIFKLNHVDIERFARALPSSKIRSLCQICSNKRACKNNTSNDLFLSEHSFAVWKDFYYHRDVDAKALRSLMEATLKCRAVIYSKIAAIDTATILILAWIAHRAVEYFANEGLNNGLKEGFYSGVNPSIATIGACLLYLAIVEIRNQNNMSSNGNASAGGVWAQYHDAARHFITTPKNEELHNKSFESNLCEREGSKFRFKHQSHARQPNFTTSMLEKLHDQINRMMLNKLAFIAGGKSAESYTKEYFITNVVNSAREFLEENFVNSESGTRIDNHRVECKYINDSSEALEKIKVKGHPDILKKYLDNHDIIWLNPAENNETFSLKISGQSLLIAPIKINEKSLKIIDASYPLPPEMRSILEQPIGYFLATSTNVDLFSKWTAKGVMELLDHFTVRIAIEVISIRMKEIES